MTPRLAFLLALWTLSAWGQAVIIGPSIQTEPYSNNYLYFNKMHWAGNWASNLPYNSQDVVNVGGLSYVSISPLNLGNAPSTSPAWWTLLPGSPGPAGPPGPGGAGIFTSTYNFTPQTMTAPLTAGVGATVTMNCPAGLNAATDIGHYLYLSLVGTPESVLVTGGSCTSGGTTGTVSFTPANAHPGGYAIGSASGGLAEALVQAIPTGGSIVNVSGSIAVHAKVTIPTLGNSGAYIIQGNGQPAQGPAGILYRAADYPNGDLLAYDQSVGSGQTSVVVRDLSIYDSGLYGSRVTNTSGAAIHIRAAVSLPFIVERVLLDSGWNPINIDGSNTVTIDKNTYEFGGDYTGTTFAIVQATYTGAGFLPQAIITGNTFSGLTTNLAKTSFGVLVLYADGLIIQGNRIGFVGDGIGLDIATASQIDIVTIVNNQLDSFALNAIHVFNPGGGTPLLVGPLTIANNHISSQIASSLNGILIGINSGVQNLQILNNRIYRNGQQGILIQGTNATIGPVQISGNFVFDNNLVGGNNAGIELDAPANYTITSNGFYNSAAGSADGAGAQTFGISAAGFSNSLVEGNNFVSPATSAAMIPLALSAAMTSTTLAQNNGIDNVVPAIASSATFAFPFNPRFTITGTTAITALTMTNVAPGSTGSFRTTSGAVTFTAGGNIGNTLTTAANVPVIWTYDGTSVWLK